MNRERRLHSHYESLTRVIQFTRTADSKAAPVLALQVVLLGGLGPRYDEIYLLATSGPWFWEGALACILVASYLILLSTVVCLSAMVYMPMSPRTGNSLIFFEDISAMDFEDFLAKGQAASGDLIETQLLDQIFRVSAVASLKMRRVRWAIMLSLPTILFWLGLLIWSGVQA